MRLLTLQQVREQYGGITPPDAVLSPDEDEGKGPSPPPTPKADRRGRRRSERFAVLNAFVDFGIADGQLTPAESLVWLVLFRDTKADTGTARTGQADIARRAGLDVRTVRRAVASLLAKGMLQVVRRGRLGVGTSIYRVYAERIA
jgi:hypothetical protein